MSRPAMVRAATVAAVRATAAAAAAAAVFVATSALTAPAAFAADAPWPSRPVSIVVPFPPGGTTDVVARGLAEVLSKSLGQTVIVDNRPGAGATLGAEAVARAKPDGYTLLMGAVHHAIATSVYPKLRYDFAGSFAPVTTVAVVPNVMVVRSSEPYTDVAGFVAAAKSAGRPVGYGSNGNGTLQHLVGTQFSAATGVPLVHVPYRGSGPLTTDLLGGQVDLSFDTVTPVLPYIRSGRLRALAVTTPVRSAALPDVPTMKEAGIAGIETGTWFALLAPKATPPAVVERLHADVVAALADPALKQRMLEQGAEPVGDAPADLAARIGRDTARFGDMVRQADVRLE